MCACVHDAHCGSGFAGLGSFRREWLSAERRDVTLALAESLGDVVPRYFRWSMCLSVCGYLDCSCRCSNKWDCTRLSESQCFSWNWPCPVSESTHQTRKQTVKWLVGQSHGRATHINQKMRVPGCQTSMHAHMHLLQRGRWRDSAALCFLTVCVSRFSRVSTQTGSEEDELSIVPEQPVACTRTHTQRHCVHRHRNAFLHSACIYRRL